MRLVSMQDDGYLDTVFVWSLQWFRLVFGLGFRLDRVLDLSSLMALCLSVGLLLQVYAWGLKGLCRLGLQQVRLEAWCFWFVFVSLYSRLFLILFGGSSGFKAYAGWCLGLCWNLFKLQFEAFWLDAGLEALAFNVTVWFWRQFRL